MSFGDLAAARGIRFLVHFTRLDNLESIFRNGLLPRDQVDSDLSRNFNDNFRYDDTNAVCLSVMFPNYKMFYMLREECLKKNLKIDWVVLTVDPRILDQTNCAFCHTNAASDVVRQIPIADRMTEAAFERMFESRADMTRKQQRLPNFFTTDPQAEILAFDGVPRQYILDAFVSSAALRKLLQSQFPDCRFFCSDFYFRPRFDYALWRG